MLISAILVAPYEFWVTHHVWLNYRATFKEDMPAHTLFHSISMVSEFPPTSSTVKILSVRKFSPGLQICSLFSYCATS